MAIAYAEYQGKVFTFVDADYRDAWTASRPGSRSIGSGEMNRLAGGLWQTRLTAPEHQEQGLLYVWE